MKKPRIALHFIRPESERSANIYFNRLESETELHEDFDFFKINQNCSAGGYINIMLIISLVREIKKIKPDIIHITGVAEGFHCMVAAFFAGCKRRIIITHGFASNIKNQSLIKRIIFMLFIEPLTIILATKIQCNSEFSMNQKLIRIFGRNKCELIYNFSPTPDLELKGINLRERYKFDKNEIIFVSVSKISLDKGFGTLAHAIRIIPSIINTRFIIIGEGDFIGEFEKLLETEIFEKRVILLGKINNKQVVNILSQCDVFILPSELPETFGQVFIEAMSQGLVCIGTKIGAIPELVIQNETGILVDISNYIAVSEAIQFLQNRRDLVKIYGNNAKNIYVEKFSNLIIVKKIKQQYWREINENI